MDVVFRERIEENAAPGVGVNVDKAGRDDQTVGVQSAAGLPALLRSPMAAMVSPLMPTSP